MSLKKWLRGWSYKYVLPQLIPIEESKGGLILIQNIGGQTVLEVTE